RETPLKHGGTEEAEGCTILFLSLSSAHSLCLVKTPGLPTPHISTETLEAKRRDAELVFGFFLAPNFSLRSSVPPRFKGFGVPPELPTSIIQSLSELRLWQSTHLIQRPFAAVFC